MNSLKQKLQQYGAAVITGASSGIGKALVESIAEMVDENFFICNISRTKSDIFFDNKTLINVPANLTNICEIDATFSYLEENVFKKLKKGKKILLINNSGFGAYGEFPAPNAARNAEMIDLNVRALTYMCGKFLPVLKEKGGAIINIASTASFQPCPYLSVYAATKAYVSSFTQSLSYELKGKNVEVLCICPGPTATNFYKNAGFSERPLPNSYGHTAKEVAQQTLKAFARGKSFYVIGFINRLGAFLASKMPRAVILKISGLILSKIRIK